MIDPALKKYDRNNMYDHLNDFYNQLIKGVNIGREAQIGSINGAELSDIVLAGMGGSAIGGELLKSFLKTELKIPFIIHRNYNLPGSVSSKSLVICSSYSGNTEETLSAINAAIKLGSKIICVTTGGELNDQAEANSIPAVKIPPSDMMPREALGYSFSPLLVLLGRMGLCRDYSDDILSCANRLKSWSGNYSFESEPNAAYDMALKLAGKIVIIYSGPDNFDAVALRLKGQISENAKQLAFCNMFPEFNHNELVGWELSPEITDRFIVLILRDKQDHPRIAKRMDIVGKLIKGKGIDVIELKSRGDSLLNRMFSLIQLGDYMSYYLALINGVDPTPIDLIDYMKQELSRK